MVSVGYSVNDKPPWDYLQALKDTGGEVYLLQYMQGKTTKQYFDGVASDETTFFAADTLSSIHENSVALTNQILGNKVYNQIKLELPIDATNFKVKSYAAKTGQLEKVNNKLVWTIPKLYTGLSTEITVDLAFNEGAAYGDLQVHEPASISFMAPDNQESQTTLNSSTLVHKEVTITFDGNGNTDGTVPVSITGVNGKLIDPQGNPGAYQNQGNFLRDGRSKTLTN